MIEPCVTEHIPDMLPSITTRRWDEIREAYIENLTKMGVDEGLYKTMMEVCKTEDERIEIVYLYGHEFARVLLCKMLIRDVIRQIMPKWMD